MIDSMALGRSFQPNGRALSHRGSRRRLRQLRARDYWTRKMSVLTALWGVVLIVLLVWLASKAATGDMDAVTDARPTVRSSR